MGRYKTEKVASFILWTVATGLFLAAMLSQSWISSVRGNYGLIEWCRKNLCFNYGKSVEKLQIKL